MTAGLVVAGGYSTRFGLVEKALVEVGGEAMLTGVVRALEDVVDEVLIDCRADQVAPFSTALDGTCNDVDPSFVVDEEPDAGPIAGLATGLDAIDEARHHETVVVSCDRPGVTSELFEHLSERRHAAEREAAVPERDGVLQPLCGTYGTDPLAVSVDAARRSGDRRLLGVLEALDALVVPERSPEGIVPPAAIESVDSPLDARRHPAGWSGRASESKPDRTRTTHVVHASD